MNDQQPQNIINYESLDNVRVWTIYFSTDETDVRLLIRPFCIYKIFQEKKRKKKINHLVQNVLFLQKGKLKKTTQEN